MVIGRVLAPVAGPRVRRPRARATAEHVATHHRRADVLEPPLDDRRAGVDLAPLLPLHLAEHPERKEPLVELHPTDPERVLRTLRAGGETV